MNTVSPISVKASLHPIYPTQKEFLFKVNEDMLVRIQIADNGMTLFGHAITHHFSGPTVVGHTIDETIDSAVIAYKWREDLGNNIKVSDNQIVATVGTAMLVVPLEGPDRKTSYTCHITCDDRTQTVTGRTWLLALMAGYTAWQCNHKDH